MNYGDFRSLIHSQNYKQAQELAEKESHPDLRQSMQSQLPCLIRHLSYLDTELLQYENDLYQFQEGGEVVITGEFKSVYNALPKGFKSEMKSFLWSFMPAEIALQIQGDVPDLTDHPNEARRALYRGMFCHMDGTLSRFVGQTRSSVWMLHNDKAMNDLFFQIQTKVVDKNPNQLLEFGTTCPNLPTTI